MTKALKAPFREKRIAPASVSAMKTEMIQNQYFPSGDLKIGFFWKTLRSLLACVCVHMCIHLYVPVLFFNYILFY